MVLSRVGSTDKAIFKGASGKKNKLKTINYKMMLEKCFGHSPRKTKMSKWKMTQKQKKKKKNTNKIRIYEKLTY